MAYASNPRFKPPTSGSISRNVIAQQLMEQALAKGLNPAALYSGSAYKPLAGGASSIAPAVGAAQVVDGGGGGGGSFSQADVQKAVDYFMRGANAWHGGLDHSILNAWNTEGQGAALSAPYFQQIQAAMGPNPGINWQSWSPADQAAFKSAVWAALSPQVGGSGDVFGHMIANQLGQLGAGSRGYDQYRGWPTAGGGYGGDAGLRAAGLDPNALPSWYHF